MTIQNLNMTSSKAVQHRIITTFPKIAMWKNYELVILTLVDFFEGKHIHVNDGWKTSKGHSSLIANVEGRHTLKILKAVNVNLKFGNDAPRGGAVGDFFKCARKNASASAFFRSLLDEVKAE